MLVLDPKASAADHKQAVLAALEHQDFVCDALRVIADLGPKGFAPKDANFGQSLAGWAKKKKFLTHNQLHYAKLLLKKHVSQLIAHYKSHFSPNGLAGVDLASGPDATAVATAVAKNLSKPTKGKLYSNIESPELATHPVDSKAAVAAMPKSKPLVKPLFVDDSAFGGVYKHYATGKPNLQIAVEFGAEAKPTPPKPKPAPAVHSSANPKLAKLGF